MRELTIQLHTMKSMSVISELSVDKERSFDELSLNSLMAHVSTRASLRSSAG